MPRKKLILKDKRFWASTGKALAAALAKVSFLRQNPEPGSETSKRLERRSSRRRTNGNDASLGPMARHYSAAKDAQTNSFPLRAKMQRLAYAGADQATFLPPNGNVGANTRARLISL